ncbi:MAG: hypothetical protein H7A40_06330 [Chlamydiales bacterium]|nr:hypothetical protein [Chlamydiales bacterium]
MGTSSAVMSVAKVVEPYVMPALVVCAQSVRAGIVGVIGWWAAEALRRTPSESTEGVEDPQELVRGNHVIQELVPSTKQALAAINENATLSEEQIGQILSLIDEATLDLARQSVVNTEVGGFIKDTKTSLANVRMCLSHWGQDSSTDTALRDSIKKFGEDIVLKYNRLLQCYIELKSEKAEQIEMTMFQSVVDEANNCKSTIRYLSGLVFNQTQIDPEELRLAIQPLEKLVNTIYSVARRS